MTPREKIINNAVDYSLQEENFLEWEDYVGDYNDDKDYIEKAYQSGAEYGYNLAIERVCEYLKFFINVPDGVETNENGEPLATSFIEVSMKRIKAAEDFTNDIKQAMKL